MAPIPALLATLAAVTLSGCAPYPLHANMLDPQFNSVLDQNFHPGMSRAQVESQLDALRVSQRDRLWYDTDPPQLLARVYQPGGRFIHQDDQTIEWVDTWFVFGGGGAFDSLTRWYTRRGSQRYFHGEPVFAPPPTETAAPTRRYPFTPPPPAEPPEPN